MHGINTTDLYSAFIGVSQVECASVNEKTHFVNMSHTMFI